jgi:hypothetical protein
MKPLRDLSADDLRTVPVWKFVGGSDAAAFVEPTNLETLADSEAKNFVAITDFVLGNGQAHIGFCSPVDDSSLDDLQPVIVTPHGQVGLWFDEIPTPAQVARQWAMLDVPESQVFPIRFKCRVAVSGKIVEGIVPKLESTYGAA